MLEQIVVTVLAEVLKISIPKKANITKIGGLLQKIDDLKRIVKLKSNKPVMHVVAYLAPLASNIEMSMDQYLSNGIQIQKCKIIGGRG